MAGSYQWLSFLVAKQQLAERLAVAYDPTNSFWPDAEIGVYICQSLRLYNSLTFQNKAEFQFVNSGPSVWSNLSTLPNSPRLRTQTDWQIYMQLEMMLLEPPTAQVWTGTTQFNIQDLSQAVQRRRDEMLQVSAANESLMTGIPSTPGVSRILLPDTVIDVLRLRFIPVGSTNNAGVTLYRDDAVALEFYEAPIYELPPQMPQTYSLSSEPPLSFDVYPPPNVAGTYEAIVLQSGTPLVPPGANPILLNVPEDFTWALVYGALADLLGRESEATDQERAAYAMKRYMDGLNLMQKSPWIMLGKVGGAAVSCDSLFDLDRYSSEWDSNPTGFGPVVVTAGIDLIAAPTGTSTAVTLLGNMATPVLDTDYLQISRSDADIVFDLAQSLAMFKTGSGPEWKAALELEKRAIMACSAENSRLRSLGSFSDIIVQRGQAEDRAQNRYNSREK